MSKVFLDAGHGGHDPGACGNGLKEKVVVLEIALRIGEILEEHGIEVAYSRQTDVFVSLMDIARKANESGADLFVSVHANASRDSKARGAEAYSVEGYPEALRLSRNILRAISQNKDICRHNRGAKHENFTVLTQTNMDAVLVECAFIDNPEDARLLSTRQQEFAEAIARGILVTIGVTRTPLTKYALESPRIASERLELAKTIHSITSSSSNDFERDRGHWAHSDFEELNGLFRKQGVEEISETRLDDPCTRGELIRIANLLQRALRKDGGMKA